MNKQRKLKVDKDYMVLTDTDNKDLVYAISKEENIKLDQIRLKYHTSTLDKIPDEYTIEGIKIVEITGNNGEVFWGIKDIDIKYKLQINKLVYASIISYGN
jgi:hypothetical protein